VYVVTADIFHYCSVLTCSKQYVLHVNSFRFILESTVFFFNRCILVLYLSIFAEIWKAWERIQEK
jgi:hypothetical protein